MSIIGLFTIGPFLFSSFLSLIGLILIALSKNEFELNIDNKIINEENF